MVATAMVMTMVMVIC